MVRISVNQAAKLIGLTRDEIQNDIFKGIIQTHEGLVTMDSLKRAYPHADLDQDSSKIVKRTEEIKKNAFKLKNKSNIIHTENETKLLQIIDDLRKKITYLENQINNHP